MNLVRLRSFLVVAEELHFRRAAERLHMAQPPLSQQIRALESELGVTLFDRTTRRVALTDAGRLVRAEAIRVLQEVDAMERRIDQVRRGEGGRLRLGFVDSSSYEVMPRLIRAHRSRWPAVEYELRSMSSDEQHSALMAGAIDVGIARNRGTSPAIRSTTILEERLIVAVGADHWLAQQQSVSISRLAGEIFVGFERRVSPTLHAEVQGLFGTHGVDYDPVIEATEYTTILGLVASGQGIAIVPASVRTFRPPSLRYVDVRQRGATSSLQLLCRTDERSPLVERVLEVAAETFGRSR